MELLSAGLWFQEDNLLKEEQRRILNELLHLSEYVLVLFGVLFVYLLLLLGCSLSFPQILVPKPLVNLSLLHPH